MSASFQFEDLVEELQIDIDENLEPELDSCQCCIYRVPEDLRRINDRAYTTQLVSTGPLHHGKEQLADIEKKKRRYMKSFLEKITTEKRDAILNFIKDNEKNICNCYVETSKLGSIKYVMMILYDATFIIELFLRYKSDLRESDLLLSTSKIQATLCRDFQLLENQLPYFVLEGMCNLAFTDLSIPIFMDLSFSFFHSFRSFRLCRLSPQVVVKHFTDWRRATLLESYQRPKAARGWVYDLPCAVKLHSSGVKFKCFLGGDNLVDIRLEKRKQLIPSFEVHELQIPCFYIEGNTECFLRNVMALEQCHYSWDTQVCNYVLLMDNLIDTEKDVDLLVGNRIISNLMGDNASVANMFNTLTLSINLSRSSYYGICKKLKEHYTNPWNRTKATLKRVYFNNLWRGTATFGAVILVLLTVIQTICSILQVV